MHLLCALKSSAQPSGASDSVVRRLRGSEDGSSDVSTVLEGIDSLVETVSLIENHKKMLTLS